MAARNNGVPTTFVYGSMGNYGLHGERHNSLILCESTEVYTKFRGGSLLHRILLKLSLLIVAEKKPFSILKKIA